MPNLPRSNKPEELVVIDETVSTTGKYAVAFGKHFRPTICWDVVAINRKTGETIRRHYSDEASARIFWDTFKRLITAPRSPSEEEETDVYRQFDPSSKIH